MPEGIYPPFFSCKRNSFDENEKKRSAALTKSSPSEYNESAI